MQDPQCAGLPTSTSFTALGVCQPLPPGTALPYTSLSSRLFFPFLSICAALLTRTIHSSQLGSHW